MVGQTGEWMVLVLGTCDTGSSIHATTRIYEDLVFLVTFCHFRCEFIQCHSLQYTSRPESLIPSPREQAIPLDR